MNCISGSRVAAVVRLNTGSRRNVEALSSCHNQDAGRIFQKAAIDRTVLGHTFCATWQIKQDLNLTTSWFADAEKLLTVTRVLTSPLQKNLDVNLKYAVNYAPLPRAGENKKVEVHLTSG